MNSGVYKISNQLTGKIYIGSSINIPIRWNEHKNDLKKKIHCNIYLQRAVEKYGIENFKFEIVEKCDPAYCITLEQKYINAFLPEYNLCKIAGSSYRNPLILKPVILYDLTGKEVLRFNGIVECAEYLKCDSSTISTCCRGIKNVTVKNYFTLYEKDASQDLVFKRLQLIIQSRLNKIEQSRRTSLKVLQFLQDGTFVKEFQSLTEARKIIGCRVTNINFACKNNTLYKGYIWKFKEIKDDK